MLHLIHFVLSPVTSPCQNVERVEDSHPRQGRPLECTGLWSVPVHSGWQDGMTWVDIFSIGSGLHLLFRLMMLFLTKKSLIPFSICVSWTVNSLPLLTWDGGGAHANSRWSEELVRTERERERERVLIQGQFGTVRETQRVWHVIFIWKTEVIGRFLYSRGNRAPLGVIR